MILTTTAAHRVPQHQLSVQLLEPLLFALALAAGPERDWLGERLFRIHVVHDEGISTGILRPVDIPADECRLSRHPDRGLLESGSLRPAAVRFAGGE